MSTFAVALLFGTALSAVGVDEPSETAMRQAFATDLSDGVKTVLAYVARTGGAQALARIRTARTDEYEIRAFHKLECHLGPANSGHVCGFSVAIDTVAGPIERSINGRFFIGACGLTFENNA